MAVNGLAAAPAVDEPHPSQLAYLGLQLLRLAGTRGREAAEELLAETAAAAPSAAAEEVLAAAGVVPPSIAAPDFPMTTPMMVAPWDKFQAQGRIEQSTKEWRAKAEREGLVVERREDMIIFFISQRWWDFPEGERPEGTRGTRCKAPPADSAGSMRHSQALRSASRPGDRICG